MCIICNRNVFTNFLPCSHAINPNNKTCLVTCAVSLTCATWLTYVSTHSFPFDLRTYVPLNRDSSTHVHTYVRTYVSTIIFSAYVCTYVHAALNIYLHTCVVDRIRATLLHEMCHAAVWLVDRKRDGHGPYWRAW